MGLDQKPVSESIGFQGNKCLNVVAEMLGAGFRDLSAMPTTHEEFTLVYCEGKKKDVKDSKLYKRMFPDSNIIFISCGDLIKAYNASLVAREGAKFMLGKDTRTLALVDRSYSYRSRNHDSFKMGGECFEMTHPGKFIFTDEERERMMSIDKEGRVKVLKRKEIENYIFDPAIISFLDKDSLSTMTIPNGLDYVTGEVKDNIRIQPAQEAAVKQKLASLIHEHRGKPLVKPIYDELAGYLGL